MLKQTRELYATFRKMPLKLQLSFILPPFSGLPLLILIYISPVAAVLFCLIGGPVLAMFTARYYRQRYLLVAELESLREAIRDNLAREISERIAEQIKELPGGSSISGEVRIGRDGRVVIIDSDDGMPNPARWKQ